MVELVFEPLPSGDLSKLIVDNVSSFTMHLTGAVDFEPVGYFLRTERGEWAGGCLGYVWGNFLHVQWLWVASRLRGQGQGARLLDAAEAMARDHGAAGAMLDTLNPSAKSFYMRRGYEVFGEIPAYAGTHARFWLKKMF